MTNGARITGCAFLFCFTTRQTFWFSPKSCWTRQFFVSACPVDFHQLIITKRDDNFPLILIHSSGKPDFRR